MIEKLDKSIIKRMPLNNSQFTPLPGLRHLNLPTESLNFSNINPIIGNHHNESQDDNDSEMMNDQENDSDSNLDEEEDCLYLTIDLPTEAINKLKSLNLDQLNQVRQLGVLSIQFENDDSVIRLENNSIENTSLGHIPEQTTPDQNLQSKKRPRKTVMELTSSSSLLTTKHDLSAESIELKQKLKKQRINPSNDQVDQIVLPPQFILTSSILDQSPYTVYNQQVNPTMGLNLKQFQMPSPMLASILSKETCTTQMLNEKNILLSEDLKNIYQIRQVLSQQAASTIISEKSDGGVMEKIDKPKGKSRRAPADPNKPKVKRNTKTAKTSVNQDNQDSNQSESQVQQPCRINQLVQNGFQIGDVQFQNHSSQSQEQLKIRNILFCNNSSVFNSDCNSNSNTKSSLASESSSNLVNARNMIGLNFDASTSST